MNKIIVPYFTSWNSSDFVKETFHEMYSFLISDDCLINTDK